jgi:hypothetical protein
MQFIYLESLAATAAQKLLVHHTVPAIKSLLFTLIFCFDFLDF